MSVKANRLVLVQLSLLAITGTSSSVQGSKFGSRSTRSLVTTLRAAEKFPLEHISSEPLTRLIDGAQAFYVEGYFLTHGVEVVTELGKKASNAGKVNSVFKRH
jgi:hypothetical protein